MPTKAMPMLIENGKFLELRNAADEAVLPATQLKTGEDAREAAKRAAEEFFGLPVPDGAIKEGFQARVGTEVVALYPVDASQMDMALLRPAEEVAAWAWRDVPESMGKVVALGFPRNVARLNADDSQWKDKSDYAPDGGCKKCGWGAPGTGHVSGYHKGDCPILKKERQKFEHLQGAERRNAVGTRTNSPEAVAQFNVLQQSVAFKAAALKDVPAHERAARIEELAQETEDLRLLAVDMGIGILERSNARENAADPAGKAELDRLTRELQEMEAKSGHYSALREKPELQSAEYRALTKRIRDLDKKLYGPRANAAEGQPVTARALIRQNDGTVLVARQQDGRSLLPGGHLEAGETPEAAVARELQEELGLDIAAAMTGESYDFTAEDGGAHRVFLVDGSRLDLSQLKPGDDVADAEFENAPFTDSHGQVHPQEGRENGWVTSEQMVTREGVTCPRCGDRGRLVVSAKTGLCEACMKEDYDKGNSGERENAADECESMTCASRHIPATETWKNTNGKPAKFCSGHRQALERSGWTRENADETCACGHSINKHDPDSMGASCRLCDCGHFKIDGRENAAGSPCDRPGCGHPATNHEHQGAGPGFCLEDGCSCDKYVVPVKKNGAERRNACLECGGQMVEEPGGSDEKGYWFKCSKCGRRMSIPGRENDLDAGAHGHEYPGRMNGAFPVVRCNRCGGMIAGPAALQA